MIRPRPTLLSLLLVPLLILLLAPAGASAATCPLPSQAEPDFDNTALDVKGDIAASRTGGYLQVPFDVPAGATAIRVRYSYDQPGDVCGGSTNTLDMGVYGPRDPGEVVWGPDESRGWSGSAVKDLAIARNGFTDDATYESDRKALVHGFTTRAYRPGQIPSGRWAVELGLAYIAPDSPGDANGIHYRVLVETTGSPDWADKPHVPSGYDPSPVASVPDWYSGDLHVHGEMEPGNATMTQTFNSAFGPISSGNAGLDFVTIVDNNNNVAHNDLARYQAAHPDNLIVPGTEVSTYRGHYNNQGRGPFVDFRNGPIYQAPAGAASVTDADLQTVRGPEPPRLRFAQIQASGGWAQINHPSIYRTAPSFCRGCAWRYSDAETDFSRVDAIEVQTGPAGIPMSMPSAFNPFTPEAIAYYEHALDSGAHIAAVGSSDDHRGGAGTGGFDSPVGRATTMVFADELSQRGIVDAVEADHTYVKLFGNDGPEISLTASVPGKPVAIIGDSLRGSPAELTASVNRALRSGRPGALSIVLLKNGTPVQTVPFAGDSFRRTFKASGSGRYSIEVIRRQNGQDMIEDYSSPIWFRRASPRRPSNRFRVLDAQRNARRGTASLLVKVPGPGSLKLFGRDLATDVRAATRGGKLRLTVRPEGRELKRKLRRRGRATVSPRIRFRPAGGKPRTKRVRVALRLKR